MNLQQAQRVAELIQERVALTERTQEVEKELSALGVRIDGQPATTKAPAASASATATPPRRGPGRPPKNRDAVVVVGKSDDKSPDLPTLLTKIAADAKRPLKISDFVSLARSSGYKTAAQDFGNMVYQALLKLCKKNVLSKNDDRDYEYVGQAA